VGCVVTPPPIGEQSIVMTVSVCVSVCVSVREHISGNTRPIFTNFFVNVTYGRGSVLLWRRCDMLCTSGFMDDVIHAHKPRQLNVAARLIEAQPTCSLGLGYKRRVGIPVAANGLTLTGLLFGRRGLCLLGRSERVKYS